MSPFWIFLANLPEAWQFTFLSLLATVTLCTLVWIHDDAIPAVITWWNE